MKSLTGRLEAIPLSLALEYVCVFLALIQLWWLKIKPQNWHRLQNYTHNKCDNLWHWQFVVRRRRRRWRWDRNRFPPSPPPLQLSSTWNSFARRNNTNTHQIKNETYLNWKWNEVNGMIVKSSQKRCVCLCVWGARRKFRQAETAKNRSHIRMYPAAS